MLRRQFSWQLDAKINCYTTKKFFVLFTLSSFLCVGINGEQMLESACKTEMFETVVAQTTAFSNFVDTFLIAVTPRVLSRFVHVKSLNSFTAFRENDKSAKCLFHLLYTWHSLEILENHLQGRTQDIS